MKVSFALKLAWREFRSSLPRLGIYMAAIALGVAALVAINSFRANVLTTVRGEAKSLLGADLRISSNAAFAPPVEALLDSLAEAGSGVARVTRLPSMVLAPASGAVRLLQVQAVTGGYPFYGGFETEPSGSWPMPGDLRSALVDPAVLAQLGIAVGDSLVVGAARFEVVGTAADRAGEVGVQSAIGPRIYIPGAFLEETGLVQTGSLVEYQAYIRYDGDAERFRREHREFFQEHRVRVQTAQGQVERLARTIGTLGGFLTLVGFTALLLGGVAVASAVHLFVEERLTSVAVLRCLGAGQRTIFAGYLIQTGMLGLFGAVVGAIGGILVQAVLPRLFDGVVPAGVEFAVHWPSILIGLGVGTWVALVFALLPLLRVREVTPVQALRRGVEGEVAVGGSAGARPDGWRRVAYAGIAASVMALSIAQAPGWRSGLAFALACAVVLTFLYGVARLLAAVVRRYFPRQAGFAVRQGVANLFRPRNQTVAVVLSLGFGVFLIGTIFLAQHSILDQFRLDAAAGRPNLLLFDVQLDQRAGIEALLARRGLSEPETTPLVPGRIAALNGRSVTELLADHGEDRPSRWALRREYRNTYRDTLVETERLVAGSWWGDGRRGEDSARVERAFGGPARISVEADLARELGIGVGDHVTWDFLGVTIETRVASLREVDWAQFAPNFFVVFEPGVLDGAPQNLIMLARAEDAGERAALQRDLVLEYPNVSVLDLHQIQSTVDELLGKIGVAVRSLAYFAVAVGILVLIGALRASRVHRLREAALLRTMGASGRQVRRILLTEYLALGGLAGVTGILCAGLGAWPLVTGLFGLEYHPPILPLLGGWIGVVLLAALIGSLNGRGATQRPPLVTLREGAG